jgi:eukaryotic-like serine/threonine-protein kinase
VNNIMAMLDEGYVIRDTYEVECFLGEGAFAEVYRVRHKFLGRQAMKVFKRLDMTEADVLAALGEALLLTQLRHPNIVSVHDANVFEAPKGMCGYFTMEFVSGGSLDRYWRSHGVRVVPVEDTVTIMRQVCRGLAIAHTRNPPIIHRDVKPQNILVGYEADGLRARLGDFGLAKQVNRLTLLASAAGTLAFKPPEAFTQERSDSCAGDVWGLGVSLYRLLTDQLPYEMEPGLGWLNRQAFDKDLVAPSSINIEVDSTLEHIVQKCLAYNPVDRYPNAQGLLEALDKRGTAQKKSKQTKKPSPAALRSKAVIDSMSPVDDHAGRLIVQKAMDKARREGKLFEAADLLEEAFNKSPDLRQKYSGQVKLWRCGISM